jgi:hypothetical protein
MLVFELPPKQLFDFLEFGIDSYIPDPSSCENDTTAKKCEVWGNLSEHNSLLQSKKLRYFPFRKHADKLVPTK